MIVSSNFQHPQNQSTPNDYKGTSDGLVVSHAMRHYYCGWCHNSWVVLKASNQLCLSITSWHLLPSHSDLATFQLSSLSSYSNMLHNQILLNPTPGLPKIHTHPPLNYLSSPKLSGALCFQNFCTQCYCQKLATWQLSYRLYVCRKHTSINNSMIYLLITHLTCTECGSDMFIGLCQTHSLPSLAALSLLRLSLTQSQMSACWLR